jgi:hypothetical protein
MLVERGELTGDEIDALIGHDTLDRIAIDEIVARVNRRSACQSK